MHINQTEYTENPFHKEVAKLARDFNNDVPTVINYIKERKENQFEASMALNIALEIYARTGQAERVNQLREIQQGDNKIEGAELHLPLAIRGYIQGGHVDAAQKLIEELSIGTSIISVMLNEIEGNARLGNFDQCKALFSKYERYLSDNSELKQVFFVAMYKGFSYGGYDLRDTDVVNKDMPEITQLTLVYLYARYGHEVQANSLKAFFWGANPRYNLDLTIANLRGHAERGDVQMVNTWLTQGLGSVGRGMQKALIQDIAIGYVKYLERYGFHSTMFDNLLPLISNQELKHAVKKAVASAAYTCNIPYLIARTHSPSQLWRKNNPGKFGMIVGTGVAGLVLALALTALLVTFFYFPPAYIAITNVIASLGTFMGLGSVAFAGGIMALNTLVVTIAASSLFVALSVVIGGLIGKVRGKSTPELQSISLEPDFCAKENPGSRTYANPLLQPETTNPSQQEEVGVFNHSVENTFANYDAYPTLFLNGKSAISDEAALVWTQEQGKQGISLTD